MGRRCLYALSFTKGKYICVKDAGLYFKVNHVNGLVEKLKQYARIIELTEDPYSGKLDVVFEDLNGFRITFSYEPLG